LSGYQLYTGEQTQTPGKSLEFTSPTQTTSCKTWTQQAVLLNHKTSSIVEEPLKMHVGQVQINFMLRG